MFAQFQNAASAYSGVEKMLAALKLDLVNSQDLVSPKGNLLIRKNDKYFTLTIKSSWPDPDRTIILRPDSISGYANRDNIDARAALVITSEFIGKWHVQVGVTAPMDQSYINACSAQERLRAVVKDGQNPIPQRNMAYEVLNTLLASSNRISKSPSPKGEVDRRSIVLERSSLNEDILLTLVIPCPKGSTNDIVYDQIIIAKPNSEILYSAPSCKFENDAAMQPLNDLLTTWLNGSE